VTQNTRYNEGIKAGYVAFVNAGLKDGKYNASDIVNIDETNVDFELISGTSLAGRVERTIGCATTGCSSRCTVLLGVKMNGRSYLHKLFTRVQMQISLKSRKSSRT
jgi:hypothetical protein